MSVLLQISGGGSRERIPLENDMDSATTSRHSGVPIVLILALLTVVTTMAFLLLSTIGAAPL